MKFIPPFYNILKSKKRFVISQGGTSSGKTWSIIQLLYLKACKHQGIHISIVAESLPVLKRGVMRDFLKMLKDEGIYSEEFHNKTDNSYTVGKSKIEFFAIDDSSKARGSRRDYLFINECNNIDYDTFTELEIRTKKQVFLDFNPVASFWVHDKVMLLPDSEWDFFKTTYLNNDQLDPIIVKSIELKKSNLEWFRVFGLGEIGSNEGVIFHNWNLCDAMPTDFQWTMYGIDFGFTTDPTAVVKIQMSNGELWIEEIIYERGLTNQDIGRRLMDLKSEEFIADSAEPKSIEELKRLGFDIKAAAKGPDSIRNGIDILKNYKMNVTKNSTNLIKELRNYQWKRTQDGKWDSKPIDNFNHCIDPIRYIIQHKNFKGSGKFDYEFSFI